MRLQAYEVVYQTMEKGEHSDSVFHRIVEQNDFLTRDKLPYETGKTKYRYVVTALDRLHNESKSVSKKLKL